MNLDSAQLQIFVSLLLVLGALFVAFICDFLKGNNEVLRERNIELTVRQEERRRLARSSNARPAVGAGQPAPERPTVPQPPKGKPAEPVRQAYQAASDRAAPNLVEAIPRRLIPARLTPIDAFASPSTGRTEPVIQFPVELPSPAEEAAPETDTSRAPSVDEPAAEAASEPSAAALNAAPEIASPVLGEPDASEPVPAPPAATLSVPPGMGDAAALERLMELGEIFRGLVVAVGVSRDEPRQERPRREPGEGPDGVEALIESLLGTRDAAFRTSEDEFILLLPDVVGTAAQRRLQEISEMLWDFQIRTMARSWILLSWGSFESEGQPLAEAVAAAKEQMRQIRRNRERPPSEARYQRAK